MQFHETFGQQVLYHKTKNTKGYIITTILALIVLSALVVAVSVFLYPAFWQIASSDPIRIFLPAILVVFALIWAFLLPKSFKALQTEGTLYENGIALSIGRGMGPHTRNLECSFDEINGIKNYYIRYYLNGIIPMPGKHHMFAVCLRNTYQAYTGKSAMKALNLNKDEYMLTGTYPKAFLEELHSRYTDYLTQNLTKDNLTQAKIPFARTSC